MADVVRALGRGGQRFAEKHLGWNRKTIRKGIEERESGQPIDDRFHERGRKKAEAHLPCVRTLRSTLNELGYRLGKVRKCRPQKKIPDTDAIFEEVHGVNEAAAQEDGVMQISLDTKATVKVGPFSRGGYSPQGEKASDHDFQPETSITPFGVLLPQIGESHLWFTEGKVTADFMVDRIEGMVPRWKQRFRLRILVINADNGTESDGHRTQWLKRLVELTDTHQLTIQLAYYPPYHSKFNPVERLWGVLENHCVARLSTARIRPLAWRGAWPTEASNPLSAKSLRSIGQAYRWRNWRCGKSRNGRSVSPVWSSGFSRTSHRLNWDNSSFPQPLGA
ncbi:MAG: transposase [Gammaproteobacteria bacterium]|nr:transposase [Gammaproteobacteria bacterium]MDJ0891890.1 transposase [Gammaproteobacteria bacterium]